ncbi:MAG: histidine kinase, partial [Caenispirillum bisanense]|nr:histidine kinase [Caenispirillum bisanense]MCA1973995.1 histidine kinase [Caenispirillum sp.]
GAAASAGIVAGGHAFEAASAPVRDAAGVTVGIVAVLTDVTERKAMEDALRRTLDELTRSNGELERFAYVASHDLQEPVRTMVGYAQLVRRRFDDRLDDDGRSFLSYIEEGALRMRALVQGLLTYSHLGSEAARPEPVDAAMALSTALDNLAVTIRETGASVVAGRLPTVYVEPLQLMQVFQNLIGNALKFRHPVRRPQVTILASRVADGWQFTVRDNGIGIPGDSLTSVFGLFKRLHGPGQFPGTGVGLAICQRIVERNGGRIWVTSEPEAGSAFHFVLPAVPDADAVEEPAAAEDDAAAMPGRIAQV